VLGLFFGDAIQDGASVFTFSKGITITAGNLTLTSGDVTLTSGDLTLTAGDLTLTAGDLLLTLGDATLTDGDLILSSGDVSITNEDARTTTVDYPLTITSTTSDTPAAGIGTGILIRAESEDENPSDFGAIEFCADDVATGTEDTYFDVLTRVAGAALTKVWRFLATGAFKGIITHANTADRTYTFPDSDLDQYIIQTVNTQTGAVATGTTVLPQDDTIPQITEGIEVMTLSITPKSTSNILYIDVCIALMSNSFAGAHTYVAALFQDSTANALASATMATAASGIEKAGPNFRHKMTAGTTSSTTFSVRIGSSSAGTTTFNGESSSRKLGGSLASSITITEYSA
jgi:hypothetical protein